MTQFLKINDVCQLAKISRATFYRAAKRGDFKIRKIGKASRVELSEINAWLDALPTQGGF